MPTVPEIWRNIIHQEQHSRQRALLRQKLPVLRDCPHNHFLSLYRYFSHTPDQFFSIDTYSEFYAFLEGELSRRSALLNRYLNEHEWRLNQAFFFLKEINNYQWHDESEHLDEYEELRFLDHHVHPAYLRVLEGVYYPLAHIVAFFSRINRNRSTDGLNLFNVVEELALSSLPELATVYRHIVRNGIAHGGITFRQREIVYRDQRGNREVMAVTEIIRLFDDLLDTCNGLALATALFFLRHISGRGQVPEQILIGELQAETDSPWWRIEGTVASEIPNGSQLLIYARPNTRDISKVQYYSFLTAVLAEHFAPGYDRYFFSFRSSKALPGWAAFNGPRLEEIRTQGPESIEDYTGVLEDNLLFYVPRPKLPRLLGKLDTLVRILGINLSLAISEIRRQLGRPKVIVRTGSIHRNGVWAVLNGSAVVVADSGSIDKTIVKRACRRLISNTLSHARKKYHRLDPTRVLPLGWARIAVFQKDYRKRRLASFGLGSDLVCTVQISRLRKIRAPDIFGSTIEQYGRFRIAWNAAWLQENGG